MEGMNKGKFNLRQLCHPGEDPNRIKTTNEILNMITDTTPLRAT